MSNESSADNLIIPVYINEKIVLDMLAIIEDGFSMVSQINYSEHKDNQNTLRASAEAGTTSTLLSKLLKIDITSEGSHTGSNGSDQNVSKEKVHTNTSLLAKFRAYLIEQGVLKRNINVSSINIGDFIEVEGELRKNPLIDCLDIFEDVFKLADTFSDKPQLGEKTKNKNQKEQDSKIVKQIKAFSGELKHSGTIDFILADKKCSTVLSAQEHYLANDNVSELIGGRFKVLGKVITICNSENEYIDLLRKTALSIFPENTLSEFVSAFKTEAFQQFHFPEVVTRIDSPAMIVIPIAIYA